MSSLGLNREYPMAPVNSEDPNASPIPASVLAALAKRPIQYTEEMIQSFKMMAAAAANTYGLSPSFLTPDFIQQAWKSPALIPSQDVILKPSNYNNNNNKIADNNFVADVVSSTVAESKRVRKKREPKKLAEVKRASSGSDSGKEKQFHCTMCSRSFGYKHVLQNHQRTHTGEKPFKCQQCDKRFTRDHHLKTHIRLHTGERPYECRFCDKRFVQVANLRRHERVHTGERPFKCKYPVCQLQFSDSNQLKAHTLTHTKEEPFACELCNVRFRRKHHLLQHKCGGVVTEDPHTSDFSDEECVEVPVSKEVPIVVYPEQTEPEDLSMRSTGRHSNTSGDSPFSRSPSSREDPEEGYLSDSSAASSFLRRPY